MATSRSILVRLSIHREANQICRIPRDKTWRPKHLQGKRNILWCIGSRESQNPFTQWKIIAPWRCFLCSFYEGECDLCKPASIWLDLKLDSGIRRLLLDWMKKLDLLLHFRDKLYLPHISFYENEIKSISHYSLCVNVCLDSLTMSWHLRLRHINKVRISALDRDDLLPNIDKVQYPV